MSDSVVVTGAAGFVGAHMVRALVHRGVGSSPPIWLRRCRLPCSAG